MASLNSRKRRSAASRPTRRSTRWRRGDRARLRPPSTRELLVLDPVRDGGVRAEPPHLVGLVVLEVALEPLDVAVALEGEHVGRNPIQEPAIVADDDGAAGEVLQRLLERAQ